ncbi:hypothetical protein CO058_01590 [candidate division WWE3 bacterium CG_4_9_14_0_2_um_filter_35_11]|uniref:Uncharacterized protein n=1 Tax=candidate division WWE3 bacterium CG_4_9_14_0_2_um_filter_35_11 TaxID=1975077 RepID=A0A2M8EM35_UNCKA|nr:MAG: hypothetical protein COV25_04110 [candidate division WWE3 bacterium CG10_big_fil_rev_8_21_14_0_10_35_32]PJC23785.1 MAG: hypothetical protein CO058_01590 [candidate division WWE3 bacterium CG_4_9_14_0_2_um_filter_35_11]
MKIDQETEAAEYTRCRTPVRLLTTLVDDKVNDIYKKQGIELNYAIGHPTEKLGCLLFFYSNSQIDINKIILQIWGPHTSEIRQLVGQTINDIDGQTNEMGLSRIGPINFTTAQADTDYSKDVVATAYYQINENFAQ